jgi:hypothetical protein
VKRGYGERFGRPMHGRFVIATGRAEAQMPANRLELIESQVAVRTGLV